MIEHLLTNIQQLFIYNNNHYNNIIDNVSLLYHNLKKKKYNKIAILSKNNKYYLDVLLLSLLKPIELHHLMLINDDKYYTNILNDIDILILDPELKEYINADNVKPPIYWINDNIKELYDNKNKVITINDKINDNINITYHTHTDTISIKPNILLYQINNIMSFLNDNTVKWLHNIPLFNPISLSYILAINLLKGYIYINTENNNIIDLCNQYEITHMRISQQMLNVNNKLCKLKNNIVIFCDLKKNNVLDEDIILNHYEHVNIVYDVLLLNMYGPILYSDKVNIYKENEQDYIIHRLYPCKHIITKHKNKTEALVKKYIYIKIGFIYSKWIKLNYNYIIYNNNINIINVILESRPIVRRKSIFIKKILYYIRFIVIVVLYLIKCKYNNYLMGTTHTIIYKQIKKKDLIVISKEYLNNFCNKHHIDVKYLLLSIYIKTISSIKNYKNTIIQSFTNYKTTLCYDTIDINIENKPIYFLGIDFSIQNIVQNVKRLKEEYNSSYDLVIDNTYTMNGFIYSYNYIGNPLALKNEQYFDKYNVNLNVAVKNNQYHILFIHSLSIDEYDIISERFKEILGSIN